VIRARELGVSEADILRSYPALTAEDLVHAYHYARANESETFEAMATSVKTLEKSNIQNPRVPPEGLAQADHPKSKIEGAIRPDLPLISNHFIVRP
jgi:hypothetical protein